MSHSTFINDGTAPFAKTFGPDSPHWSTHPGDNEQFILINQNWQNDRLQARGVVFLNEVYEALGLPRTQTGQLVGWAKENNTKIQIEIVDDSADGGLILDFNPDGNVLHLLP